MDKPPNNYAQWEKADIKEYILYGSIYKILKNANWSKVIKKQSMVTWGVGGDQAEGRDYKEAQRRFGDVGYVHSFDCDDDFMVGWVSDLIKSYTLIICSLFYVNFTSG